MECIFLPYFPEKRRQRKMANVYFWNGSSKSADSIRCYNPYLDPMSRKTFSEYMVAEVE